MLAPKKVAALCAFCCGLFASTQSTANASEWFTCSSSGHGQTADRTAICADRKSADFRTVQDSIRGKDGTTWWKCADEGGVCRFRGNRKIAYGAKGKWFYRTYRDSVPCNSGMFGGDPILGQVKACYYESDTPDKPLAAVDRTWTKCANENGICHFQGERRVAFGANGRWSYRIVRNGVNCGAAKFGDPIVGVVKSCYIDPNY